MRIEQLEYLAAVTEHGSLRRASEAMHISQPALSEAVTKLEKDGFVKPVKGKFAGRTKPYELTDKGRALYSEVRSVALGREDLAREALSRRAALQQQVTDLETQHATLQGEEEKLTLAAQRLQAKVDAFRTKKETIKATYTAAQAQTRIGEAFSGISEEMGDVGLAIQRAEDKTAQLQARAGAIDELLASGALDGYVEGLDVSAERAWDIVRQARRDGIATEREENEPGIACVAVPVLRGTTAIAAVSVTAPVERMPDERVAWLGGRVREVLPSLLPQGLHLPDASAHR